MSIKNCYTHFFSGLHKGFPSSRPKNAQLIFHLFLPS